MIRASGKDGRGTEGNAMTRSKFYITTPIYYVNDSPHIGHAYTTILADVLSRYYRLMGLPTHFLTGTDEHGQKVQAAAQRAGMSPQEQADGTVVRFQELWHKLQITNDDFIRTTEPRHKLVVQKILQDLYDRGEVYRAEYDGWYCVACERFFTEKDLVDEACPEPGCHRPVEKIRESNYFFRMSKYHSWLIQYIHDHPKFIQPDYRRNETLGFLKNELTDLCISRPKTRLNWGIELPFDKDFVTYVWFDALVNYISAVGYLSDDSMFRKWWPASYHLIGKDILTTHTVYWPAMLKAMNLPMPETVFAHGWWLSGRDRMSKTAGNAASPMEFADRYGVDAFRYFLLAEMSLGQDASFTEEAFVRRYNADLANDLGNLVSRVVKLMNSSFDGHVPAPGVAGPDEERLQTITLQAAHNLVEAIERMRVDQGLAEVAGAVREANRYVEKKQPWVLANQPDKSALGTVLYAAAESLRIVSGLLSPVLPSKMAELRGTLGLPAGEPALKELREWGRLVPGTKVGPTVSLFPRVQPAAQAAGAPAAAKPEPAAPAPAIPGVVAIEHADFQKIELRTARILSAEKVPGADKLLKLEIEIGAEKRQLLAGIALHYKPEELPGKTVVVVANLKPKKIRGIESNGMLLAASSGSALKLLTVDGELPSGATVK